MMRVYLAACAILDGRSGDSSSLEMGVFVKRLFLSIARVLGRSRSAPQEGGLATVLESQVGAVAFAIALLSTAGFANASTFRGASIVPSINGGGVLMVTLETFWNKGDITFPAATDFFIPECNNPIMPVGIPITDTTDSNFDKATSVFKCNFTNPGGGLGLVAGIQWSSPFARVSGINNALAVPVDMFAAIFWQPGSANTPISFTLSKVSISPKVVRGTAYSDNLGANPGGSLTLTYDQVLNPSILAQPPGFTINPATGDLSILPIDTTSYLNNPSNVGADYAFSGSIRASDGSLVQFDWLFDAVSPCPVNCLPDTDDDGVCDLPCAVSGQVAGDNCLLTPNPNQFDAAQFPGVATAEPHGNLCDADYDQSDHTGLSDFLLLKAAMGRNSNPVFDCTDSDPGLLALVNLNDFTECFLPRFGQAPGP
jgi:hypothetical protein